MIKLNGLILSPMMRIIISKTKTTLTKTPNHTSSNLQTPPTSKTCTNQTLPPSPQPPKTFKAQNTKTLNPSVPPSSPTLSEPANLLPITISKTPVHNNNFYNLIRLSIVLSQNTQAQKKSNPASYSRWRICRPRCRRKIT